MDVVIVGAGIVGLATARELLSRWPRLRLAIVDKETRIAAHQSGHNSGVIHTGIYYAPGSLKARLCVTGGKALLRYCDEHDIAYDLCGKVIVATDESELPRLDELQRRGEANGVAGLEAIGPERLQELEPHARGIRGALFAKHRDIDYVAVAESYAADVRASGGQILLDRRVSGIRRVGPNVSSRRPGGAIETRFSDHLCRPLFGSRRLAHWRAE